MISVNPSADTKAKKWEERRYETLEQFTVSKEITMAIILSNSTIEHRYDF